MMEFRRRKRSDIGIDMTPMIDCVFQLLIFFLLSSAFLTPAVGLQLPRASAETASPPSAIFVTVDAAGQMFLNTAPVSREELPGRLLAEFRGKEKREVVLRADRALPYEKVVDALLAVQRAGGTQVHLAYEDARN